MNETFDVAIVGGGIVGLAHAWAAVRRNLHVLLLERSPKAAGASVRNFGMIWPIGQTSGDPHETSLRSREMWLQLGRDNVVDVEECGSLHLAHHADEAAVLEEFAAQQSHAAELLTPEQVQQRAPLANPRDLQCGLYSAAELRVDPRTALPRIAAWLAEQHDVQCRFNTPVVHVEGNRLHTSAGDKFQAERIIICSGSDLRTLFPEVLQSFGLRLCKLQMLRTVPQPEFAVGTPHIASGLTLRHYPTFANCATLPALKQRIAEETPELDEFGIHVMASQSPGGEVVLGDSHEYGDDIAPWHQAQIDDLMLRELRKVIKLPDWTIAERWDGIYAKHPEQPCVQKQLGEHIHIFTGTGGGGMTMSFDLAEQAWQAWSG